MPRYIPSSEMLSEVDDSTSRGDDKLEESRQSVTRLAIDETRNVRMWRRNVFLMLFATACLVTTLTYIFLGNEDEEDFETAFNQFALTIEDNVRFNLLGVLEATDGLSEVLTSEAKKTNSEWPFVTLSSFEVFVRHTRAQAASELIVVAPIVTKEHIEQWNNYSTHNQGWIDESFEVHLEDTREDLNPIPSSVYRFGRYKGRTVLKPEDGNGDYPTAPFWQMSPPPFDTSIVNFNSLSTESYQDMYNTVMSSRKWTLGMAGPNELIDYTISQEEHDILHSESIQLFDDDSIPGNSTQRITGFANDHPHTSLVYPVFRELNNDDSDLVAMVVNILPWDNYLKDALPDGVRGLYCVLHNSMGQSFTYVINGKDAEYRGSGDHHDRRYDDMVVVIELNGLLEVATSHDEEMIAEEGGYNYWFSVYPSRQLEEDYESNAPAIFAAVTCSAFIVMTFTFILYDWFVIQKNNKILGAANRSDAILSSLFPKEVKNQLLKEKEEAENAKKKQDGMAFSNRQSMRNLRQFMNEDEDVFDDNEMFRSKPIAELFPETTVLFCDLVGFTAWSSTREPASVFVLLETLFHHFDKLAAKKMVYKVETIGDCYVAITGCPEPRPDHFLVMVRFARECLHKVSVLTMKLEETLGPDTANLSMRFGIHSGPVTAGVLRGERSRFQLFGDTVNTASRIESSGAPGRIHISEDTANLLKAAGKGHWLEKRSELVRAKGKGDLQTYWLTTSNGPDLAESIISGETGSTSSTTENQAATSMVSDKMQRLIQWNVQRFTALLKDIAANRGAVKAEDDASSATISTELSGGLPLEEVKEVIELTTGIQHLQSNLESADVTLDPEVITQLNEYITIISSLYENHAFHNFEHASHVCMSVLKLMARFESPGQEIGTISEDTEESYSFAADPLTQFACAFSALVHDVHHPGVPNPRLMLEDPEVAEHYKGRSVAEQRSFDLAWELLQEDRFVQLRMAIYSNRAEETKFRQLVVNCVMSTDIFDRDLKQLRNDRWEKAFSLGRTTEGSARRAIDRKATIVIEHLIQASDVSHTMQHWSVYCKWNERLYEEMYQAFLDGRSDKDPTQSWYEGEIWFFDNYIIPLAKRLKECGVYLGASGDEYLDFATRNRKEWEEKGKALVADMHKRRQQPPSS